MTTSHSKAGLLLAKLGSLGNPKRRKPKLLKEQLTKHNNKQLTVLRITLSLIFKVADSHANECYKANFHAKNERILVHNQRQSF